MKINETIEDILMYQKHTRDCDYYLYNQILKLYDAQNITALELLKAMKNKTIPSFESVSRARTPCASASHRAGASIVHPESH